jgi:hypothetical protein
MQMNAEQRGRVVVRALQCFVYLSTGLVLGYFSWMSMMWGIWGAPVHIVHYLAVVGALALLGGAFICLVNAGRGRIVAIGSLLLMGTFWGPATASLVPQHSILVSPVAFFLVSLYLGAIAFSLFYPTRWRWSFPALFVVLLSAIGIVAATAIHRVRTGEFSRPSIAYFRWHPSNQGSIEIVRDSDGWIDTEVKTLLEQGGIHGQLAWTGASGERDASHRLIIIAAAPPPQRHELPYPRDGVIVYIFDGSRWRSLPQGTATYPAAAILEPQGSNTMLWQESGGGRRGTTAFTWSP